MSVRLFENDDTIEVTKNTVKFGNSVYQSKNVTGFTVGKVPKPAFPLIPFLGLCLIGFGIRFSGIRFNGIRFNGIYLEELVSAIFLLIGLGIFIFHFAREQRYGLVLHLNSGQEKIFTSPDKKFLTRIVLELYKFMEEDTAGTIAIDMSNRSITVTGDIHGSNMITGNSNLLS